MAESAVDDMRLAHSGTETIQAGIDLGDHPLVDDPLGNELAASGCVQMRQKRLRVPAVLQDPGSISQKDEFLGAKVKGNGGGSGVAIDVEPVALGVIGETGDDRDNAGGAEILDEPAVNARHSTDSAQVNFPALGSCSRFRGRK